MSHGTGEDVPGRRIGFYVLQYKHIIANVNVYKDALSLLETGIAQTREKNAALEPEKTRTR